MSTLATTGSQHNVPALARAFLGLLQNLHAGSVELITPDHASLHFKGGAAGPHAILRVHDWS
ncbi:MAG TPA: hypothetical protein VF050_01600, partial [Moraxellaceae bacterium]